MLIFKRKKNKENEGGFTLVEALISITILMISVAAPLNLASQGLVAADIAQRQIVAYYLAQDAQE
jgi:type II secretory pathway pseudopilin PulG